MLPLEVFYGLLNENPAAAEVSLKRIGAGWRREYAAMMLETVGFVPSRDVQRGMLSLLGQVSGRPFGGGLDDWYRWLWSMEPAPHPDYAEFKAGLYEQVDPRFREYFAKRPKALIRLDEIRWGGVWRDGIPPLANPKMIPAREARYLAEDNIVFGVAIDGEARAYPKRILAWHEMVKDTIAGRPLNGVYCTLCGAMIVYDVTVDGVHHELGTSGFLYRSNKLMYDHATKSLWSTLTGTPVVGPLAGTGIELQLLHVVTTTWKEWKKRHPQTLVLSLDTGHQRDYSEGAAYREYFATDRLMFGVPSPDSRLSNKAEVLALRFAAAPGEPLAIAADFLRANRVHHDRLGPQEFVVLTDASGANRVYASASVRFASWDGDALARDRSGRAWKVGEDALTRPGGAALKRLPAHRAFWFGWHAAFPGTRLVK
ncbi:MAG: DUF3179 domain-containing protein [Betaproteobacteria bacterium]|nr:DUF3179 domain-containing protein [Betaproteobacteria bacterium]